jgi:hypothetical protein
VVAEISGRVVSKKAPGKAPTLPGA